MVVVGQGKRVQRLGAELLEETSVVVGNDVIEGFAATVVASIVGGSVTGHRRGLAVLGGR